MNPHIMLRSWTVSNCFWHRKYFSECKMQSSLTSPFFFYRERPAFRSTTPTPRSSIPCLCQWSQSWRSWSRRRWGQCWQSWSWRQGCQSWRSWSRRRWGQSWNRLSRCRGRPTSPTQPSLCWPGHKNKRQLSMLWCWEIPMYMCLLKMKWERTAPFSSCWRGATGSVSSSHLLTHFQKIFSRLIMIFPFQVDIAWYFQ